MTSRRLGVAAAIVDGALVPGDVALAGGEVEAVGLAPAGRGTAVPGFVDLQVNGFGGVDLLADADDDAWARAAARLLATGVTAFQPTLITAPPAALRDGLRRAARLQAAGGGGARILGVHLEGPFLAPERLGTHPAEHRRDPDAGLLGELLAAGPVTTMTLAPERDGALDLLATLVARGVLVSVGHSAAPAPVAHAAFDAGARAATHLFNAMAPITARDPGIAAVALTRADVTPMCIVDGVHLADETVRLVLRCAAERLVLTSDAIAAAGVGDGRCMLGSVAIEVRDGRATRADGTLAGSVGTVAGAVRRAVALGATLEHAVGAATATPARLLGRADVGVLAPGAPADVVVLDDGLEVAGVWRAGTMVEEER